MSENTMTPSEIRERLWASRGLGGIELSNDEFQAILESLDHLSRPVSVSDEDVERALRAHKEHLATSWDLDAPSAQFMAMREALEADRAQASAPKGEEAVANTQRGSSMDAQLCDFAARWTMDGDYLRCRKCKRPCLASYADRQFQHASDCKWIDVVETYPWRTLLSILEPLYTRSDAKAGEVENALKEAHDIVWSSRSFSNGGERVSVSRAKWYRLGTLIDNVLSTPRGDASELGVKS